MRRVSEGMESDEEENEINLTPMLDVVFILLIFFIVTSVFIKEAGIEVQKPEASTADPRLKDLILIAVSPQGDIWIDGEQVDETGAHEHVAAPLRRAAQHDAPAASPAPALAGSRTANRARA